MNEVSKISKMLEDAISEALIKAVKNLSIEIDEEEFLKMLRDSKEQYQRGYKDREQEIVRCRECIYWQDNNGGSPNENCKWRENETPDPEDFCSAGERKYDDD